MASSEVSCKLNLNGGDPDITFDSRQPLTFPFAGLIGKIIGRFEDKGYKLVAMKLTAPGKEHVSHFSSVKLFSDTRSFAPDGEALRRSQGEKVLPWTH